jgi:hypothetical protein
MCAYCTISFNLAGPVTRDGPAENFVLAFPKTAVTSTCSKIWEFSAAGEENYYI